MSLDAAERAIQDGDLETAVAGLQAEIRRDSANSKLRIFLFQLLCVVGQWERALTQLKVAADLDAEALPMAQMYRETIGCELVRAEVFAGRKSPMVFGEPAAWLALLIESLLVGRTPGSAGAQELRARAFEAAPVSIGSIDGKAFAWIADRPRRHWCGNSWRSRGRSDRAWTSDAGAFEDGFSARFFTEPTSHETTSLEMILKRSAILANAKFTVLAKLDLCLLEQAFVGGARGGKDHGKSTGSKKGHGQE